MARTSFTPVETGKIKSPVFRVSYPVLDEPRGFRNAEGVETNPQFSLMAVWKPKEMRAGGTEHGRWTAMLEELDKLSRQAFKLPFEKLPGNIKRGLRDGLERPNEAGEGAFFASLTAKPKYRPGIVDRQGQPLEADAIYAGCYCRATFVAYAFSNVSKGVGFGLRNVQKVADGERLDGGSSAEDDFSDDLDEVPDIDGAFDVDSVEY